MCEQPFNSKNVLTDDCHHNPVSQPVQIGRDESTIPNWENNFAF
jgi:hypothetical protein